MNGVLTPLGSAPEVPDCNAVDSWSMKSMDCYLNVLDHRQLHTAASRAVELEHRSAPHFEVLSVLAAAETFAARLDAGELSVHAARLDAYVAAHGLRGWYRYTDLRGVHAVRVNMIRTREDGERGRYFIHRASPTMPDVPPYWVIDRDSGRTAATFANADEAQDWISHAEGRAEAARASRRRPSLVVETLEVAGGVL